MDEDRIAVMNVKLTDYFPTQIADIRIFQTYPGHGVDSLNRMR